MTPDRIAYLSESQCGNYWGCWNGRRCTEVYVDRIEARELLDLVASMGRALEECKRAVDHTHASGVDGHSRLVDWRHVERIVDCALTLVKSSGR